MIRNRGFDLRRAWLCHALTVAALIVTSCGRRSSAPAPTTTVTPVAVPASWADVITGPKLVDLKEHLTALAAIGGAEGNRAAGTTGFARSIAYIEGALPADFIQQKQVFSYKTRKATAKALTVITAEGRPILLPALGWSAPQSLSFSGAIVAAKALVSPYPSQNPATGSLGGLATGCDPSHFPVMAKAAAVVVAPGGCPAATKTALAAKQGAALIIRLGQPHHACLGHHGPTEQTMSLAPALPELVVDPRVWRRLTSAPARLSVKLHYQTMAVATENLIARYSPGGTSGRTFVAGGHLDSVTAGSGINDNGSGVAALLALAKAVATTKPPLAHDLTLVFWGGEEDGLKGSAHYVQGLSDAQKAAITSYLNLDMVASPNFGRFLYGSGGTLANALSSYYRQNDLSTRTIVVGARSDHYHFQQAGIDVAGLYTGGLEPKSDEAAGLFGGEAGKSYDACYHLGCDSSTNISEQVLLESYRAVAHTAAVAAGASDSR